MSQTKIFDEWYMVGDKNKNPATTVAGKKPKIN